MKRPDRKLALAAAALAAAALGSQAHSSLVAAAAPDRAVPAFASAPPAPLLQFQVSYRRTSSP